MYLCLKDKEDTSRKPQVHDKLFLLTYQDKNAYSSNLEY